MAKALPFLSALCYKQAVFVQLLGLTGYLLEGLLLWRLTTWRAWRVFPMFASYFLLIMIRQAVLAYSEGRYGSASVEYSRWFWFTASVLDIVKLLVAWEVFRKAFLPGSAAQRFAGALLVATLAGLSVFYALGGAHDTFFFVALGVNFSFVVAVWIFGVLTLAKYYQVALGRNLWGIALGVGIFSAAGVVNFSLLGLHERTFPVFAYVRPLSFVMSLAIWTCCLWSFRPALATEAASASNSAKLGEPLQAGVEAVGRALRPNAGSGPDSKEK